MKWNDDFLWLVCWWLILGIERKEVEFLRIMLLIWMIFIDLGFDIRRFINEDWYSLVYVERLLKVRVKFEVFLNVIKN